MASQSQSSKSTCPSNLQSKLQMTNIPRIASVLINCRHLKAWFPTPFKKKKKKTCFPIKFDNQIKITNKKYSLYDSLSKLPKPLLMQQYILFR